MPKKKVEQDKIYGGVLAAYGDPRLDAMVAEAAIPKARAQRVRVDVAQECPGCGSVAILHRERVAVLCQACHDGRHGI